MVKINKEKSDHLEDLNKIKQNQGLKSILRKPVKIKKEPISEAELSQEDLISKVLEEQVQSLQKKRKSSVNKTHSRDSSSVSKTIQKQKNSLSIGVKKKLSFEKLSQEAATNSKSALKANHKQNEIIVNQNGNDDFMGNQQTPLLYEKPTKKSLKLSNTKIAENKFVTSDSSSSDEEESPKPIKARFRSESDARVSKKKSKYTGKVPEKSDSNAESEIPLKDQKVPRKYIKTDSSSGEEVPPPKKDSDSSSSDEQVPPPRPILVKKETKYKQQYSKKHEDTESSSKPLQIKSNYTNHSDEGEASIKEISKAQQRLKDPESSSDEEEVLPPKPIIIKHEKEVKQVGKKTRDADGSTGSKVAPPKPIKIKQKVDSGLDDSDSDYPAKQVIQKKTKSPKPIKKQELKSSSDESEPPAKQLKLGAQPSKTTKQKVSQDSVSSSDELENVAPARPIPVKQDSENSSEDSKLPTKQFNSGRQKPKQISKDSESSSEENEPIKHIKLSNRSSKTVKEDSESSSEEELALPKPIAIKQCPESSSEESESSVKQIKLSQKSPKKIHEDSESSSEEELALPKPIAIKQRPESSSEESESSVKQIKLSQKSPKKIHEDSESISEEVASPKLIKNEASEESDFGSPVRASQKVKRSLVPNFEKSLPQVKAHSDSDSEYGSPSKIRKIEKFDTPTVQYKHMDLLDRLSLKYPGIKKLSTSKVTLPDNAKYSLLLVPQTIDPQALLNMKCHLGKTSLIILNKKEYLIEPSPKKPEAVLLSIRGGKIVQLESVQIVQRYVPNLVATPPEVALRENMSLPDDLKARHPLFGVEYKNRLHLDAAVKVKLEEAVKNKIKVERKLLKKRSKQKRKRLNVEEVEENVMHILNSIDSPTKKHKSKKHLKEDLLEIETKPKKSKRSST